MNTEEKRIYDWLKTNMKTAPSLVDSLYPNEKISSHSEIIEWLKMNSSKLDNLSLIVGKFRMDTFNCWEVLDVLSRKIKAKNRFTWSTVKTIEGFQRKTSCDQPIQKYRLKPQTKIQLALGELF